MNNHISELEGKLNAEPTIDPQQQMADQFSPKLEDTRKSLVMFTEPSFSLGFSQMEMDEIAGPSVEPATETEDENTDPLDPVAKRTRSRQEEVSSPPKSALAKIGNNLDKYAPIQGTIGGH